MPLKYPILQLLAQIQQVLDQLTDEQYAAPVGLLSGATIGNHVRHVIEFYLELTRGYECGVVRYDRRERDHSIASERRVAIGKLQQISLVIARPDKELRMVADLGEDELIHVRTNYFRELIYNLEHTVHHMALLRVGIEAVSSLLLPPGFGVAISTIKYRNVCVQ